MKTYIVICQLKKNKLQRGIYNIIFFKTCKTIQFLYIDNICTQSKSTKKIMAVVNTTFSIVVTFEEKRERNRIRVVTQELQFYFLT